jgi:hypothetical protein
VKKAHRKTTKAKAKAAPVTMEYDGDLIQCNIWFKIGLTKTEAPMLKTIGRRIFGMTVSSAAVLRTLLLSALAHYDKLEPLMFADGYYKRNEGFLTHSEYLHGVIASQQANIAPKNKKAK